MGRSRQVSTTLSERCYGACDPSGTRIIKQLALDKAESQLASRDVHTELLYRQISKYVALHPPDRPHTPRRKKKAIKEAVELFHVSERTVREAIRRYPEQRHFTAPIGS